MSSTQSDSASISVSGEDSDLDAGSNASGPSRKRARPRPRPRPRAPSSRPQPQARPRLPSKSKSKSTNVPGGRGRDEKSPHPSTSSTHHPRSKPETKHTGSLPPIRQYVLSKLTLLVHTLFSSPPSTHPLTEEESARYAADVERAMFQAFKDIHPSHTSTHTTSTSGSTGTGGSTSESAGTRYKTQFNLLTSSLTKNKHLLRPSLLQSILSLSLPPGSLALLSASDLASAAQLEEMERAKQAVLESTVKTREEREMEREMLGGGGGGMIAGRDGLERLEDTREKEMWEVRKEEERERERSRSAQYAREHELRGEHQQPRERRESEMERDSVHTDNDGSTSKDVEHTTETTRTRHEPSRSPTILHPHSQQRRTSTALAPTSTTPFKIEPAKPVFELTSAWGTGTSNILHGEGNGPSDHDDNRDHRDHRLEQDQEKLYLSNQVIVGSVGGVGGDGEKGDLDLDLDLGYGSGEMDLDELDYTGELNASAAAADSQGGGAAEIENRAKGQGQGGEGGEENRQRKKWEELMNRPIEWTGRVSFSLNFFLWFNA